MGGCDNGGAGRLEQLVVEQSAEDGGDVLLDLSSSLLPQELWVGLHTLLLYCPKP